MPFVVRVIALLSLYWYSEAVEGCISECFQRRDEFGQCSKSEQGYIDPQLSNAVLVTFCDDQTVDDYQQMSLDVFYQAVPYILCEEESASWQDNRAPFCTVNASQSMITTSSTPDSQCSSSMNCSVEAVILWDWRTNTTVPASHLVQVLNSRTSQLALHSLGVPFLHAAISKRGIFDDVPIGSWISLLVGVVACSLVLSQPLWWTRGIKRIFKKKN